MQTYYVVTDHLGTPQVLTDQNQAVVWRSDATPFGEELNPSPQQSLRFPGQYADAESGYSYNYFRDYDSRLGRYVQSDPIGLEGGLNLFAYAGQNPIIRTDFYGLRWWTGAGSVTNRSGGPIVVTGDVLGGGKRAITIPDGATHNFNDEWIEGLTGGGLKGRLVDPDFITYPDGSVKKIEPFPWDDVIIPLNPNDVDADGIPNDQDEDSCRW